jgi:hypothetical protein
MTPPTYGRIPCDQQVMIRQPKRRRWPWRRSRGTQAEPSLKCDDHVSQSVQWKTQLLDEAVCAFLTLGEKRELRAPGEKDKHDQDMLIGAGECITSHAC